MLHHKRINDVTQHVTQGYNEKEFLDQENAIVKGESTYSHNGAANKKYYNDRHSTDVDDGVNSSDGDYDAAGFNLEALEIVDTSPVTTAKDKSSGMRLSHAESTDSGMGFSDNLKEGDASRLSAGDGYGTIHLINPPPLEEHESGKSLLDGDVEYDEVIEFMSSPTRQEPSQNQPTFSTFKTPPKNTQDDTVKSPGDSASKYAELDVAKILHTRRRHRHASTLGRRLTEEKQPDENVFNSLKRKSKSKNYSISTYGTYGRNRKPSKQQSSEWGSRPPSNYNDDSDTMPVRSGSVSAAFHRRSSKGNMIENTFGHYNTLNTRRNNYSDDLMMTSDVSDDVMNMSATIDRTMWNHSHNNGLTGEADDSLGDVTNGSNRWSWLSNSSHSQSLSNEKTLSSSKSPWKIFRRLLGGRDKRKTVVDGRTSTPNLSSPKPRSTSLFRRFSMRKSGKNQLGKRRNSVPAKSEWDVQNSARDSPDMSIHVPVIDAAKQRPIPPASVSQPSRGRLSSRLLSFRGGKNRSSKRRNTTAISKGLSISSPQLSVNAIDPTRNYCDHQLLNLGNLTIRDGKK